MNPMYPTIIEIIAVILPVIMALLALSIGSYPRMLKVLSYTYFPPAKFYLNAMKAIERLEALSDKPSTPESGQLKQGITGSSDVGFRELVEILRENRMLNDNNEVEEIILGEIKIASGLYQYNIPLTSERARFLGVIQKGEQILVQQEQFDPSRITRDLKDSAERIARKRVANWIIVILALHLIASISLAIIT
jgi:hypothetical protein